jgi:hypothetical protein
LLLTSPRRRRAGTVRFLLYTIGSHYNQLTPLLTSSVRRREGVVWFHTLHHIIRSYIPFIKNNTYFCFPAVHLHHVVILRLSLAAFIRAPLVFILLIHYWVTSPIVAVIPICPLVTITINSLLTSHIATTRRRSLILFSLYHSLQQWYQLKQYLQYTLRHALHIWYMLERGGYWSFRSRALPDRLMSWTNCPHAVSCTFFFSLYALLLTLHARASGCVESIAWDAWPSLS